MLAILFIGLPRAAEPVAALMPLSWEEALGKQVVGGFAAHNKFCNRSTGGGALDRLTARLGERLQIVGDDLLVTNMERHPRAIDEPTANSKQITPLPLLTSRLNSR